MHSLIFDYFARPRAHLDSKSHQNLQKVKKVTKKGSHFGAILCHFQLKNESKMRLRFGIDFHWFWCDFGNHFGAILIHFHI